MAELEREHARAALGRSIADAFLADTEAVPADQAAKLAKAIDAHVQVVQRAGEISGLVEVWLALRIAAACRAMLDAYADLDEPARAAVVGAVRYFLSSDDTEGDLDSPVGFEDDARVVDYVLALTGVNVPPVSYRAG